MSIEIIETTEVPQLDRGYVISIVIKNFKQHRDVDVHLFRPSWDPEEYQAYDWPDIVGNPLPGVDKIDPISSRKVLLETFTRQEKDTIVEYLKDRYNTRLKRIRVGIIYLPIPLGLVALSEIEPQGEIGIIKFEEIPNYPLSFPFHGLYNLAQHPLVEGSGTD